MHKRVPLFQTGEVEFLPHAEKEGINENSWRKNEHKRSTIDQHSFQLLILNEWGTIQARHFVIFREGVSTNELVYVRKRAQNRDLVFTPFHMMGGEEEMKKRKSWIGIYCKKMEKKLRKCFCYFSMMISYDLIINQKVKKIEIWNEAHLGDGSLKSNTYNFYHNI